MHLKIYKFVGEYNRLRFIICNNFCVSFRLHCGLKHEIEVLLCTVWIRNKGSCRRGKIIYIFKFDQNFSYFFFWCILLFPVLPSIWCSATVFHEGCVCWTIRWTGHNFAEGKEMKMMRMVVKFWNVFMGQSLLVSLYINNLPQCNPDWVLFPFSWYFY